MSEARALVAALARMRPRSARPVTAAALVLLALVTKAAVASPETFAVRIDDADSHVCSGFHVADRLVAFAGHCVVKTTYGDPSEQGGELKVTRTARVQFVVMLDDGTKLNGDLVGYSDPVFGGDDWALVRLRGDMPEGWPTAELDCTGAVAATGTRVLSTGYPAANDPQAPTLSEGFVNGRPRVGSGIWRWPLMYLTLPDSQGASGSALQRASDGKVIGIFVATVERQPVWSYAQPIAPICAALHIT